MDLRKLVILLCTLFSRHLLWANQALSPEVILNRCAQAMGSPQHSLPVLAEGQDHGTSPDSVTPIRIKTRGLEDFRLERNFAGGTEISIISKGRGWHHGLLNTGMMSRHTTAYFKADHLPALACRILLENPGMRAVYIGDEVVESKAVFHVKLDAQPRGKNARADRIESLISEYHLFIDQQSFTVLKTAKYVFSPDAVENRSLWESTYSDYRNINGVLMPFHIDNFLSGRKFSTTIFKSIQTDVALSDQEFKEAN